MANILKIPAEVLQLVFTNLTINQLVNCERVCKEWRLQSSSNLLYVDYVNRQYELWSGKSSNTANFKSLNELAQHLKESFEPLSITSYFKSDSIRDLAIKIGKLERNWKNGTPSKVIDMNDSHARLTLTRHKKPIHCVLIDRVHRLLLTGDMGGNVFQWDLDNGRLIKSFDLRRANELGVQVDTSAFCMSLNGNVLAIGSYDPGQVFFAVRDSDGNKPARGFHLVSKFVFDEGVQSLTLEKGGQVCIVGLVTGDIHFLKVFEPVEPLKKSDFLEEETQSVNGVQVDADSGSNAAGSNSPHPSQSSATTEAPEEQDLDWPAPTRMLLLRCPEGLPGITDDFVLNYSMVYMKPFLFTTSNVLIHYHGRHLPKEAQDDEKDIWELKEDTIRCHSIQAFTDVNAPPPGGMCLALPDLAKEKLLVAFPDLSIQILDNFNAKVANPPTFQYLARNLDTESFKCLKQSGPFTIVSTAARNGNLFVVDNVGKMITLDGPSRPSTLKKPKAHCKDNRKATPEQSPPTEDMHSARSFDDVLKPSQITNCIATDPCYFITVTDDNKVMHYDFRPQTAQPAKLRRGPSGLPSHRSSSGIKEGKQIEFNGKSASISWLAAVQQSLEDCPNQGWTCEEILSNLIGKEVKKIFTDKPLKNIEDTILKHLRQTIANPSEAKFEVVSFAKSQTIKDYRIRLYRPRQTNRLH